MRGIFSLFIVMLVSIQALAVDCPKLVNDIAHAIKAATDVKPTCSAKLKVEEVSAKMIANTTNPEILELQPEVTQSLGCLSLTELAQVKYTLKQKEHLNTDIPTLIEEIRKTATAVLKSNAEALPNLIKNIQFLQEEPARLATLETFLNDKKKPLEIFYKYMEEQALYTYVQGDERIASAQQLHQFLIKYCAVEANKISDSCEYVKNNPTLAPFPIDYDWSKLDLNQKTLLLLSNSIRLIMDQSDPAQAKKTIYAQLQTTSFKKDPSFATKASTLAQLAKEGKNSEFVTALKDMKTDLTQKLKEDAELDLKSNLYGKINPKNKEQVTHLVDAIELVSSGETPSGEEELNDILLPKDDKGNDNVKKREEVQEVLEVIISSNKECTAVGPNSPGQNNIKGHRSFSDAQRALDFANCILNPENPMNSDLLAMKKKYTNNMEQVEAAMAKLEGERSDLQKRSWVMAEVAANYWGETCKDKDQQKMGQDEIKKLLNTDCGTPDQLDVLSNQIANLSKSEMARSIANNDYCGFPIPLEERVDDKDRALADRYFSDLCQQGLKNSEAQKHIAKGEYYDTHYRAGPDGRLTTTYSRSATNYQDKSGFFFGNVVGGAALQINTLAPALIYGLSNPMNDPYFSQALDASLDYAYYTHQKLDPNFDSLTYWGPYVIHYNPTT